MTAAEPAPENGQLVYPGSTQTIQEAVAEHLLMFVTHPKMSKENVTSALQTTKRQLPPTNILPSSYKDARKCISSEYMMDVKVC